MKRFLLAFLALLVLTLPFVYFAVLPPNPAVQLFAQIRQGMSVGEAKAILGDPDVTMRPDDNGHPIGYSWGVAGGRIFVFASDQTVIAVDLDEDGLSLGGVVARMSK